MPIITLSKVAPGVYTGTFPWKNVSGNKTADDTYINVFAINYEQTGTSTINKIKLEKDANYNPIYNEYDADINEVYYKTNCVYKRKYIEGTLISAPNNDDEHKVRLVYNNGTYEYKVIPYT